AVLVEVAPCDVDRQRATTRAVVDVERPAIRPDVAPEGGIGYRQGVHTGRVGGHEEIDGATATGGDVVHKSGAVKRHGHVARCELVVRRDGATEAAGAVALEETVAGGQGGVVVPRDVDGPAAGRGAVVDEADVRQRDVA